MAASARRKITITYSGDVEGEQILSAANNATSPATVLVLDLGDGPNAFTVPAEATAVTIVKPGGNVIPLRFKVDPVDTGVRLHNTDPDTISLHSSIVEFTIDATLGEVGACQIRLFFS